MGLARRLGLTGRYAATHERRPAAIHARRPDRHGVLRTRRPLRASSTATCLRYVFTTLPTTTTHSTTVRLPLAEGLRGCGAVGLRSLLRSPQPFPLVPLSPALHSFRDSRD